MYPFTIYHSHLDDFTSGQKNIVEQMRIMANPDAIYLLGASRLTRRSESIFMPEAPTSSYTSHCFYLLLMPGNSGKTMDQWQDQLEHAIDALPFTVLALDTIKFKDWLKQGHLFACHVYQKAPLLFKSTDYDTSEPVTNIPGPNHDNEKEHHHAIRLAKEFMAGAELYLVRRECRLASLMLHQAAEQSLRSLLQRLTGYTANIHSVERLLRYTALVSYEMPDVFNAALPTDKKLLALLQKAYVSSRYDTSFIVKACELERLIEKIKRIIIIAEKDLSAWKHAPVK